VSLDLDRKNRNLNDGNYGAPPDAEGKQLQTQKKTEEQLLRVGEKNCTKIASFIFENFGLSWKQRNMRRTPP